MASKKRSKKILKVTLIVVLSLFVLLNVVIAIHAYRFTHFDPKGAVLNPDEIELTTTDKVKIIFTGVDIPRPLTRTYPTYPYKTIQISGDENENLETWLMHTDSAKHGTVAIFHGFVDEKSAMLDRAYAILDMGYDVLLVDFIGSGGSDGVQSTIGYTEARVVKRTYDYILGELGEDTIYLLGCSMGAAAITKAQADYDMVVDGIILEAPYGTFLGTVGARLDLMDLPRFPVDYLFTFWCGMVNGFDAFTLNPQDYVKEIHVPTLLMCGDADQYIPVSETQSIFDNLASEEKDLQFFSGCEHESYLTKHPDVWKSKVQLFFSKREVNDIYFEEE